MIVHILEWAAERGDEIHQWAKQRFDSPEHAERFTHGIAALAGLSALAAVVTVVWVTATLLGAILTELVAGLGGGLATIRDWDLTVVISAPVHSYITTGAAALGLDADLAAASWAAWALAGIVFWLLATFFRATGARIGWILYGCATAAMVHADSPAAGAWLAVGITAMYWSLLSIPALAGLRRRNVINLHQVLPEPRPAERPAAREQIPAPARREPIRVGADEDDGEQLAQTVNPWKDSAQAAAELRAFADKLDAGKATTPKLAWVTIDDHRHPVVDADLHHVLCRQRIGTPFDGAPAIIACAGCGLNYRQEEP